jgi:hypothetical protein
MARGLLHRTWNRAGASARLVLVLLTLLAFCQTATADSDTTASFRKTVQPILRQYCTGCHNSDLKKGGIDFDPDDLAPFVKDKDIWSRALKMLRAGMMPPNGKRHPTMEQVTQVANWIKYSAFGIDPHNPDPGRITLHRLNRTEYRNTIRDLLGVDFNATAEFPADDTGHGFDSISDVLTISPLLLEKYIAAAKSIIAQAVPTQPWVPAEKRIPGRHFVPLTLPSPSPHYRWRGWVKALYSTLSTGNWGRG